jgi:hypothetical protein
MDEEKIIRQQIALLEDEHRSLDFKISNEKNLNMLEVQRLKKQKLGLKDQIARLYSIILPDITA